MMLNAAWIMVAALCISYCNGYVIPDTPRQPDPAAEYVAHPQSPSNGTGKPADAWGSGTNTVKDPSQKVVDASPGAGIPYSQAGSYGPSKAPADCWNGTRADGDADGKDGSDASADGHVPWPSSTAGQGEPWGHGRDGSVSSSTGKVPPSPDSHDDGLWQPPSGADSGRDGHQPYDSAPYGGADSGHPNGTLSSATSKTNPDTRSGLTDDHQPVIPSPDGQQPWPSPTGSFGSPTGNHNDYDDEGKQGGHLGSHSDSIAYPPRADCSSSYPAHKAPYQHGLHNGAHHVWSGTAASSTHHLHGHKPADSEETCDPDASSSHGSTALPTPQPHTQSPCSTNPDSQDDQHDSDPYSSYSQPVLSPSAGNKNSPTDSRGH